MAAGNQSTNGSAGDEQAFKPLSRTELAAWRGYKKSTAHAFINLGYCVGWSDDASDWMDVYLPEQPLTETPELRAELNLMPRPGTGGLDGSRVTRLTIYEQRLIGLARTSGLSFLMRRAYEVRLLFNSATPRVDVLGTLPPARSLYDVIMAEAR